jgi:nucleotidyltransferase/DNA polymerase involved in DNA repair
MVVCFYIPRFELVVAAGEGPKIAHETLAGRALAVAPLLGGEQRVGEVSGAAEAQGVARGMALGEALARCPDLVLVPGDPVQVAEVWERTTRALESIGAAVEPAGPGLAYFESDPLRGIHGTQEQTLAAAARAGRSVIGKRPVHIGAGPTRFCALAAALAVRSRRPLVIGGPPTREARRWLAGRPIGLLGFRQDTAALVRPLSRLGVRTLGELTRLGRSELTDRFGAPGALAHRLACGEDSRVCPRRVEERLEESMEVGDASSGEALKRVLGVLVDRLLARPERRGRTLRAATLSALLLAGGGWRERVVFRQALCDPERIWLALSVRLLTLPAPAAVLRLSVDGFGPPVSEQGGLFERASPGGRPAASPARVARLREAVAQVRTVAGQDAALRAVCVDPDSRVPERRVVLAPIPD